MGSARRKITVKPFYQNRTASRAAYFYSGSDEKIILNLSHSEDCVSETKLRSVYCRIAASTKPQNGVSVFPDLWNGFLIYHQIARKILNQETAVMEKKSVCRICPSIL